MADRSDYASEFDESAFWRTLKRAAGPVLRPAVILWLVLKDPATPQWAKLVILGALGYLVSPFDAIPDVAPLVGFTDDVGVLITAVKTVAEYVTDDIRRAADAKVTV